MPSSRAVLVPFLVLLSCALLVPSRAAGQTPAADLPAVADSARGYLREIAARGFSGVVLVRYRGAVLLREGFGFTDCARTRPMTPATVFDIGSITKAMTSVAVLQVAARGQLSLHDSLGRFFAGVPPDKAGITVEQLLRHTSGLPEALGSDEDYVGRRWLVAHALAAPLVAPPGGEPHYSNVGYSLLGAIVERVTGRSYEAVLRTGQLDSAGLRWTGYTTPAWPPDMVACGRRDGRRYGATRDYFTAAGPSWHLMANGGVHSTVDELARWFDAVRAGALLPPDLTAMFVAALEQRHGTLRYLHSGGSNLVFSAEYFDFPDVDLVVIVLTSDGAWPKEKVVPGLLRQLRPLYAPGDGDG